MAQARSLSDYLDIVGPLIADIISYELRIRGVQPAQALSTKRAQLARELLEEYNGNRPQFAFHLTSLDDLRACAALNARFDGNLTSNSRTENSIRATISNLIFLEERVKRIFCNSSEEENTKTILNSNISGSIYRAERLIGLEPPTQTRQNTIDLSSHGIASNSRFQPKRVPQNANSQMQQDGVFNASEQLHQRRTSNMGMSQDFSRSNANDLEQFFSNMNLHSTSNQQFNREPIPSQVNRNPLIDFADNIMPNSQSIPHTQTQFNQNIPLSSTNANFRPNYEYLERMNSYEPPQQFHTFPTNRQPQYNRFSTFSQRRDHKIYKWNIKFGGEDKNSNAIDFIQRVNATAQSRGVTDTDLFEAAIELFSGQALKWYFASRDYFNSWSDISEKLISDFVDVDYYDNLLDTIRQRKQTQTESIVHFFTIFEDDCSRLQTLLTSNEKINILKKNILQKYRPHVTLKPYGTLDELKYDLKLLEATMANTNSRSVNFEEKDSNQKYDNSNRRSRYDNYRSNNRSFNRSFSRSPSNGSNHSNRDSSQSRKSNFRNNRPATPVNNNSRDQDRNNSHPQSDSRDQQHSRNNSRDNQRYNSSERNRNNSNSRSQSRESNSSYKRSSNSKHLNK